MGSSWEALEGEGELLGVASLPQAQKVARQLNGEAEPSWAAPALAGLPAGPWASRALTLTPHEGLGCVDKRA